eukprot:TRINITY_DN5369_c0_g1_i1.p2 TRINITY_DN5369_c0_g1~~TRINITY_DN5369_c0_g1_i1.p2  ORF type:complete len:578 (+),score=78.47 TRINITY_DN5369_c0_g1_i1:3334-5067(+)
MNSRHTPVQLKPQTDFKDYEDCLKRAGGQWEDDVEIELGSKMSSGRKVVPELCFPKEIGEWEQRELKASLFKSMDGAFRGLREGIMVENCWLLDAMEYVAKQGLPPKLFPRYNEDKGVYEVNLWRVSDGSASPLLVTVDSRIASVPRYNISYAFVGSDEPGELWPALVEKALAKAAVPQPTPSGIDVEGFPALDGRPGLTALVGALHLLGGSLYSVENPAGDGKTWEPAAFAATLRSLMENGPGLRAVFWRPDPENTTTGPRGEPAGQNGLVTNNAYLILEMREVTLKDGGHTTLLLLRNPWGERGSANKAVQWRGKWGDESPLWKENRRVFEELGVFSKRGGTFWMDLADVAENAAALDAWLPQGAQSPPSSPSSVRHSPSPQREELANEIIARTPEPPLTDREPEQSIKSPIAPEPSNSRFEPPPVSKVAPEPAQQPLAKPNAAQDFPQQPTTAGELVTAVIRGDLELLRRAIYRGNSNSAGDFGKSLLHFAAETGNTGVIELLFENGAEVEATDKYGRTPLHLACLYGHDRAVKFLLDVAKANPWAAAKNRATPLDLAEGTKRLSVVRIFPRKG